MAVTQYYGWFSISGILFEAKWLNYEFIGFNYFIGPSVCFFFFSTLELNFKLSSRVYLAYLPGILALLLFPLVDLVAPTYLPEIPQQYFLGKEPSIADFVLGIAFLQNNIYYYTVYRRGSVVFNFRSLKSETVARIFLSLFIIIGLINIYGLVAFFVRELIHLYIGSAVITVLIVLFFLFSQRFPEFFLSLETAIETAKDNAQDVKKSSIEKLNLKELHLDLVELMNSEKLYLDEDLTLGKVADELDIKPYQLSEFMNKHLQINFSQFVNLEEPEGNILTVAFKVGFSSKANFNLSFNAIVGKSPRAFLKEKLNIKE